MTAPQLLQLLALTAVGLGGLLAILLALRFPWRTTALALLSLPLLPPWLGVQAGPFFVSAHVALAAVAMIAILRVRAADPPSIFDWLLVALFVLTGLLFAVNRLALTHVYGLAQWLVVYGLARVASSVYGAARVSRVFVIGCSVSAVMLLFEFLTGINVWVRFLRVSNSLYTFWSADQFRGGVLRAEAAFGHSIAAGCTLAVAAALAFGVTGWRTGHRLTVAALLAAGAVVTFSRLGMVSLAVGIGLVALFGVPDLTRRTRATLLGILAAGGLVVWSTLSGLFERAGQESSDSAAYRSWLLELIPTVQPFGTATSFARSTAGVTSFGTFKSIDSQVLLFLLIYGAVPGLLVCLLLLAPAFRLLRGRGGPATAAALSQVVVLVGVALITQYALVFWLALGLSTTEAQRPPPVGPDPKPPGSLGSRRPAAPVPQYTRP